MSQINVDFAANRPLKIRAGAKQQFTATFDNSIDLTDKTVRFNINVTDAADLTPVLTVEAVVVDQVATFTIGTADSLILNPKMNYVYSIDTIDGDNEVEVFLAGKVTVSSANHL